MDLRPRKLYPKGTLSFEPSTAKPGQYLIRVAPQGQVFGPYPPAELEERAREALAQLGYTETALGDLLSALESPDSRTRALAALRLGRRGKGDEQAAQALLKALPKAIDDSCSILDALGDVGVATPEVLEALRAYAERKLLSRRRSAVEALRKLGQLELDPNVPLNIMEQPAAERGRLLDQLYELDRPEGNAVVRQLLPLFPLERKDVWRYVKSVFKRAILRGDAPTFALCAYLIERAPATGAKATVKSGYDGEKREVPILSGKTKRYLQRLSWRHLRGAENYAQTAAHVLAAYKEEDAVEPRGLYGGWSRAYLLHRILWGASERFKLDPWRLRFKFRDAQAVIEPADLREESFPERWDAHPQAYLTVLADARTLAAQRFAAKAVARHPGLLQEADAGLLMRALDAPLQDTQRLVSDELLRRLDPERPDWTLIEKLVAHEHQELRERGYLFLERTAGLWCQDPAHLLSLLDSPNEETRSRVAELAIRGLSHASPTVRHDAALMLWTRLREPDAHPALARVAVEALLEELRDIPGDDLRLILNQGSPSGRSVAAALLAKRPDAIELVGVANLVTLAEDEVVGVRRAAHLLVPDDPSILLILVESPWPDTRELAFRRLRAIPLDYEAVIGLCDSNRKDVQDFGKELVARMLPELDTSELLERLSEHPHGNMRSFALQLILEHLLSGAMHLEKVRPLFRALFLDLHPRAEDKRKAVQFLVRRGTQDPEQARLAAEMLDELVRSGVKRDAEAAIVGLTHLGLVHPGLKSKVRVQPA